MLLLLFFTFINYSFSALSFKSGSIINSTASNLRYRSLTTGAISVFFGAFTGAWYSSVEVDLNSRNKTADGDFIWGAIYVGSGTCPIHWHGYWNAHVEIDRNINPNSTNFTSFNVSASSSFIASSYLMITEKGPNGTHQNFLLNGIWQYKPIESRQLTNASAGLYVSVFDGIVNFKGIVQMQFIATEQAGTIDLLGGIPVFPKAIETIFFIKSWNYKEPTNSLSLTIAVGSAQFSASINGQVKSGAIGTVDQVYFRVAKEAYIDDKPHSVTISTKYATNITEIGAPSLESQLATRFSASASVVLFEIDFPAGAKNIAYDPTIGSGESPYDSQSSFTWAIILGVVLGVVLLLVIATGIYVMFRRRPDYSTVY